MAITGTIPEKIGFLVPMTPSMVTALLGLSFMLLVGRWLLRRNRYKLTYSNNQPNRAGQSTREMAALRYKNRVWFVLLTTGIVLLIILVAYHSNTLGIGGFGFVGLIILARLVMNYSDAGTKKMMKEERRAIRGAKGEEKVGSILESLGEEFLVIHDVLSPYGNIDHVVISKENGIFLLETKAHGGRVSVNNGHLLVNGYDPEKDFIAQTLNNTYWLRDKICNLIDVHVWVIPVLVFTNAFVEGTAPIKGVKIINKKYLLNTLQRPNTKAPNLVIWEKREKIIKAL